MIAITLGLLGLALWPASRLRIETELTALLPDTEPAAVEYQRFLTLFGGFERVFVLIVARDPETSPSLANDSQGRADPQDRADSREQADPREQVLAAAEVLAPLLAELPEVAKVRAGLQDEDQTFFLEQVVRRAPMLIPDRDLEILKSALEPAALRRRARQLRSQIHSPAGRFELQFAVQDPLGVSSRLAVLGEIGGGLPVDPWTGAFLSEDGEAALLVLTPALGEMDAEGGRRLDAGLHRAFESCRRQLGDDGLGLDFAAVGGPLYAAQDERQIRADLRGTILGSALACTLILLLAFGGLALPGITMSVLGVALVWAAATLSLTVGSVTGAGLGFAAVLVGLGVDYGIHGGTRFRGLRLAGLDVLAALEGTFRDAGPAIATSALSTACAFAALAAADFRPLREIGTVVSVGILAILVAFATLGAALVAATGGGVRKDEKGGLLWRALDRSTAFSVGTARRFPRVTLIIAGVITALTAPGLLDLRVDPDLRKLRPADHPALEAETLLVSKLGVGASTLTVVVPGRDRDQALDRASEIASLLRGIEDGRLSVVSPSDLLISSGSTEQRLSRLAELPFEQAADTLSDELRAVNVNPRAFSSGLEALRRFGAGRDVEGRDAALPESLDELLTVDDQGRAWAALRVRLAKDLWTSGPPEDLLTRLRQISPEVAVASVPRLGSAMKSLAQRDFLKLSWISALLVVAVVLISFRGRMGACMLAVTPVAIGSLWTLGAWGQLGFSLDLLSLSVAPILIGIGIDDGLHAVHGATNHGTGDGLGESVRRSGLAMALTTLTTCVGFGSLATSSIPGLRNGGLLVAVGVLLCLMATLWVLPAVGALMSTKDELRG